MSRQRVAASLYLVERSSNSAKKKVNVKGPRIRELRERAGISQAEFARRLQLAGWDCDVMVVNRVELQKRSLTDVEIEIALSVLKLNWAKLDESSLPRRNRPER